VVDADSDPQAGEHAVPSCVRVQATPWFFGSYPTVAVNGNEIPTGSSALVGASATVIAETVTVAELEAALSATEVAMMLTLQLLDGGVAGAV
jgi:hypothetical protein